MRKLVLIFKNGIRRSVFLVPLAALMLVLMFLVFEGGRKAADGYGMTSVPIAVIDKDKSALSADMLRFLEEELQMQVFREEAGEAYEEAYDRMTQKLLDCKVSVILEIPQGLEAGLLAGQVPELSMTALDDYANEAYTKSYLNTYLQKAAVLAKAADGNAEKLQTFLQEAKETQTEVVVAEGDIDNHRKERDGNGIALMTGFFTFVAYGYSMYMGMLILEDKKNGTFKRIQVSSVKPATYIGGISLSSLVISAIVVAGILIMLAATGVQSNIPLWLMGVLLLLFVLFCIGFNLIAAFLAKSNYVFMTIGVAFISISNILGGAYFPMNENALEKFSVLTPQYFMMNLVHGLTADAGYNYITDLCVLFLMTVLVYLIASVVYSRREN